MGPLDLARSARRDVGRPALPRLRDARHEPNVTAPEAPDAAEARRSPADSDEPGLTLPGVQSPGEGARSWREWPGATAATILPGRGPRRMTDRTARVSVPPEPLIDPEPPADHPSSTEDATPVDGGPAAVDAQAPPVFSAVPDPLAAPVLLDVSAPVEAPLGDEAAAVRNAHDDASPEEIIAGTAMVASAPTAWVAQRPTVAADGAADSLREAVADLQTRIERAGAEIQAMVAGHRAELTAARSDFAPIRDWLDRAQASIEREAQERAEDRAAGRGATAVTKAAAMPVVPVDPLRIMTSATGRIGLPSRHAAAAQEWATAGHRGAVEVTHPGARRRVGVAAALYAATLGHTVRAVVPDRTVAESWRTDLVAHAPEITVIVDTGEKPPSGRADVVVTVDATAWDAATGTVEGTAARTAGSAAEIAATLLVLSGAEMVDSVDPRCPWRLVLTGPGEWDATAGTVREHVDNRLIAAD